MKNRLRVLILEVALAAMVYGAALTLVLTGDLGTATAIVVVIAGSAVTMGEWIDDAAAVLQTFYAGMEGGRALADLLFGVASPSGKLPFAVPADEADLPFFDRNADAIAYGPLHGYTLFDHTGATTAFGFGHGLSYAHFSYRALKARRTAAGLEAQVSLRNDGAMHAEEVVQVYVGFPGVAAERPRKLLRGFRRVALAPGETRTIIVDIAEADLRWWSPDVRDWLLERGAHTVFVGGSAQSAETLRAEVVV